MYVATVEHTKQVEKIATKHDVTSNHHNTLERANGHQKPALSHGWTALVAMQLGNYEK